MGSISIRVFEVIVAGAAAAGVDPSTLLAAAAIERGEAAPAPSTNY